MKKDKNKKEIDNLEDVVIENEDEGLNPALKIKSLREKLKICEGEKQEYLTGWQRAKADLINANKEQDAWRKDFIEFANKNLIDELLPVIESFNLAFGNKEAWEKVDKNWRTGVEYIYSQLFTVLERHGLVPIGEVGEEFEPTKHLAVENIETDDINKDGKVSEVMQKGFKLKEKVIRPARVKVFKLKN